ncbi:MAG: monooxygenase [Myxococcales bacterium]|nr:monooxygenase [Myxococcales bacterium]
MRLRSSTCSLTALVCVLAGCSSEMMTTTATTADSEDTGSTTAAATDATTSEATTAGTTTAGTTDDSSSSDTEDTTTGEPAVTYHRDVRPILAAHCEECHTVGKIAPFPLTTYDEVFELRELVLLNLEGGVMPPWPPAPDCGDYLAEKIVAQAEIDTVRAWVEDGAAEGDPADYVPPDVPDIGDDWQADVALEIPEPYVPIQKPDDYRCFLLDWPEQETAYVSGFRAVPGELREVHHVIAFSVAPDKVAEYEALDAAEEGPGYTCFGGPGGEIVEPDDVGVWLGAWAPGFGAGLYPEGTGLRMEPGSKVVLQVHYNVPATGPLPDQTRIEFKVEDAVEREAFMLLWADILWLMGDMHIPAGSPSTVHTWEYDPTVVLGFLTDVIPSATPFEIHVVGHHMHTLGVRGRSHIVREGGEQQCLLDIPDWDFNWQGTYMFKAPVPFYPGDRLHVECEFDNSKGGGDVNWGDKTTDEMCLGIYYITEM